MEKRKHYVIKVDEAFHKAMAGLRYLLRAKSDGAVLYQTVMTAFEHNKNLLAIDTDAIKKVNKNDIVKESNKATIVEKIKKLNLMKTSAPAEGYLTWQEIQRMIAIPNISAVLLVEALHALGYQRYRMRNGSKDRKVWLVRKKL